MRVDTPTIVIVTGPTGSAGAEVVGSPPLILPVDSIVVRGFDVEAQHLASLGHVSGALKHVVESAAASSTQRIRQREIVEQRHAARIPSRLWNDVQSQRVRRRRPARIAKTTARIARATASARI